MTLEEFRTLAQSYPIVPVAREVLFDTNTAVTAYARIKEGPFAFLLESVVGGEKWARYTFLGSAPREAVRVQNGKIESWTPQQGWHAVATSMDPLSYLEQRLAETRAAPVAGLPRFFGGAVGYLAYDVVRYVEALPNAPPDDLGLPEMLLIFTDTIVAIDNVYGKAIIICCAESDGDSDSPYHAAIGKIEGVIAKLQAPLELSHAPMLPCSHAPSSSYRREAFERDVDRIKDYIRAGDVFQVVLSQRIRVPFETDPLSVYRKLRSLNPSPYLYLLELDGIAVVGSSPEVLVRVEDARVVVKPIAGTRRRGANEVEDAAFAAELLADEKERAEHLMLVDLGRNDVGRVARFGTVEVKGLMQIERYSHVLHIVSQVEAELRAGASAMSVFRACFPAGTVSGAPKVRAMEIIDELEPVRRGPYAGAVGYFGYGGQNMDTAIAIRTLIAADGIAYVQAGAGVVVDSVPAREWAETLEKAGALLTVLGAWEHGIMGA
ncbi:MAG: anthranilate synthase component I [Gemmatimonadota bacterium]